MKRPSISATVMCGVLARAFVAMNEATARDTVIALASRAAIDLLDADGIFLIAARQDRCIYVTANDSRPINLRLEGSSLRQLATDAGAPRLYAGEPEHVVSLPDGSKQRLATMLLLPLVSASGWSLLAVFWFLPHQPSPEQIQACTALSGGLGLALQLQLKEQELARSSQRYRRLVADLQHRVRNTLAFVRSIIRRTGETAESAEEFVLHLEARISALARTQSTLALAGPSGVELEDLVRAEMTAAAIREDRAQISGPPIRLHAKGAETLAMALHELATNSLKYGALTTSQGHITVSWQTDWTVSPPYLRVSWIESGVKMAALAPRRRGFGQELIENTLPYQLDAQTRFSFMPGGLQCVIDVPLNERTTSINASNPPREVNDGPGTSADTR